jgi:hypothetical protein
MPRYIVRGGTATLQTPAGADTRHLWFGIETDASLSHLLEFLSRYGYDLIPAEGMTLEELASVGVEHFESFAAARSGDLGTRGAPITCMSKFVKGQPVKLPNGRRGAVAEINEEAHEVRCVIDPEKSRGGAFRGGGQRAEWYKFEEVETIGSEE